MTGDDKSDPAAPSLAEAYGRGIMVKDIVIVSANGNQDPLRFEFEDTRRASEKIRDIDHGSRYVGGVGGWIGECNVNSDSEF